MSRSLVPLCLPLIFPPASLCRGWGCNQQLFLEMAVGHVPALATAREPGRHTPEEPGPMHEPRTLSWRCSGALWVPLGASTTSTPGT